MENKDKDNEITESATDAVTEEVNEPVEETAGLSAMQKRKKRILRLSVIFCSIILFVVAVLGVLQLGCVYTESTLRFWTPDYEMTDITSILEKETLTEEEYETLYRQTGITRIGIDDMRTTDSGKKRILQIQSFLFREKEIYTYKFGPFTYMEELKIDEYADYATLVDLQDGDIIVSSTMRFSWWRLGHSALVVDGESNRILEAIQPGAESSFGSADTFTYRGNFIVLRPKASAEIKRRVVEYAEENLVGIPYWIPVGVVPLKYGKNPPIGSNCSHLVWYAYRKLGIDLDYNKGAVVVPRDLAHSDDVEVVQVFGFDLDDQWK